ncbi:unnamed protein product [Calypogeia fissa]
MREPQRGGAPPAQRGPKCSREGGAREGCNSTPGPAPEQPSVGRRLRGPAPAEACLDHFRPTGTRREWSAPGPKCWRQEDPRRPPGWRVSTRPNRGGGRLDRAGPDCRAGVWGDEAKGAGESPSAGAGDCPRGDGVPRAASTRAPSVGSRAGRGSWDERAAKCQGEGTSPRAGGRSFLPWRSHNVGPLGPLEILLSAPCPGRRGAPRAATGAGQLSTWFLWSRRPPWSYSPCRSHNVGPLGPLEILLSAPCPGRRGAPRAATGAGQLSTWFLWSRRPPGPACLADPITSGPLVRWRSCLVPRVRADKELPGPLWGQVS